MKELSEVRATRLLLLVGGLVAVWYLAVMLHFTSGQFLLPLDDSYIYLRYAERLATGHPFQYGPGEPPSTGATSPLYVLVLLPGALAGLHGDALAVWVYALDAVLYLSVLLLLVRFLGRVFAEREALLAALLVGTTGVFAWGFLSGMEIGLTVLLLVAAMEAVVTEVPEGRLRRAPILLALLVFTRPEAMLWAVAVAMLLALLSSLPRRQKLQLLWPLVAVVVLVGLNLALTGRPGPDTGRPKSPLMTPYFAPFFVLQQATGFLVAAIKTLLPGLHPGASHDLLAPPDPMAVMPPFALVVALIGAVPLVARELRARRAGPHTLLCGTSVFGLLTVAVLGGGGSHHFRYLIPFLFPVVIYLVPGAGTIARLVAPDESLAASSRRLLEGLLLAWQALTLVVFAIIYGREARSFREYREASLWIRDHVAPSESVAALDVGVVGLYSRHRVVDLFGLTTARLAPANAYFADAMGSRFEEMVRWPERSRPRFFLAHRVRFDERGDEGHLDPFRRHPVARFGNPPSGYGSVGRDLTVWAIDWSEFRTRDAPQDPSALSCLAGRTLQDALNVADVRDEARHHYRFSPSDADTFQANRMVTAMAADGTPLTDGVRGVVGTESFRLHASRAGDARLILRTNRVDEPLAVAVNGVPLRVEVPTAPGRWSEACVVLPSGVLKPGDNEIAATGTYVSARWWLFAD